MTKAKWEILLERAIARSGNLPDAIGTLVLDCKALEDELGTVHSAHRPQVSEDLEAAKRALAFAQKKQVE
ncbi:MAG TPA: hypothetical protein VM120_21000 [Bryobacteraceae bacterium]|nr:hypothetical protein [Bryobacteraceae bacterium]